MNTPPSPDDILDNERAPVQPPPGSPAADPLGEPKQEWRRSLISRTAIRLGPLYGAFYDWQMRHGNGVQVVRHRIQLPGYPSGAPGLRAVFLSDLHYGPTSGSVAAKQAWALAREAKPDVLFLGGDYVYGDESGLPTLIRELQRWQRDPPPGGIYACLGNHDLIANVEAIVMCLEACGVKVLVNDVCEMPAPWQGVWIAGTDDERNGDPQPDATLAKIPRDACKILLAHEPDICESNAPTRSSLTLCGHTHGGQICLPGGKPMYVPSKWSHEYPGGLYRHSGHWVFVSKGVGTVGFPLRTWCPPEIAVFDFFPRGVAK